MYTCVLPLYGYDENKIENKYKICIQASTWDVTNPDVQLKYYTGSSVFDQNLQMVMHL